LFKIYHRPDLDVDLKIEVDPVEMNLDHCVSCGLILNELISNVFKHSFNSASQGIISIFFKEKNPGQVMLTVMDDGCGLPPDFNMDEARTLGLKIVSLLVTGQLNGSLRVSPSPGTRFDIQFPLGQKA
jgi:two-component sensor histidine kinase